MNGKSNHIALRTSLFYAFFASIWILISDRILASLLDPVRISDFQTYKGWVFVVVTAGLLYIVLRGQVGKMEGQTKGRLEAEASASQAAEQLRLAVGVANVGLWDWDLRANKVYFSPVWKRQIGYEEHEIPNDFSEWESRLHPEDLKAALEKIRAYIANPSATFQNEYRFRSKDGSYRWILAQGALVYDARGKATRMLGSHVDVTESKQLEIRVRENETRLRLAMEAAGLAFWEIDLRTGNAIWSDKLFTIVGLNRNEIKPSIDAWRRLLHPDDVERMEKSLESASRECPTTPVFSEYQIVRPSDGKIVWISQAARFFLNKAGQSEKIVGVAFDVTERKRAEEDLLLRNLALEHSLNGFDIVDENGLFVYANPAYLRMWGFQCLEEIVGTSPASHCADPTVPQTIIGQLLAKGQYTSEFVARRKDGSTFDVLMASRSFKTRGGQQFFISTSLDITERKFFEKNMTRMNAELETRVAQRTAELDARNKDLETFSYSVSHDLKAPLRGIRAYGHLLMESHVNSLNDEGRRYLKNIAESAEQMQQLIEDLLAYFTLERRSLAYTQVNPVKMVESILKERKHDLQNVQVTVELAPGRLRADAEGLAIALRNLIDNAVKFSAVRTPPIIGVHSRIANGRYIISVSDNGSGFDMKYCDRIFQIFQRLHRAEEYSGTGIGLALVQKAVERMGGRVSAESAPEKGATFHLEIPCD